MDFLSVGQQEQLAHFVAKANGKAILLVHPYLGKHADKWYFKSLKNILAQTKTPVIILEGNPTVQKLEGFLSTKRAKCFVLPTGYASPALSSGKTEDWEQKDLAELLKSVGVKKVFLGGKYSDYGHDAKLTGIALKHEEELRKRAKIHDHPAPKATVIGCTGITYSNLIKSGINVRVLSQSVYPDRPEYWPGHREQAVRQEQRKKPFFERVKALRRKFF